MSIPESISLLLGAGFSAPMGYPIGNRLNDLLLNCDGSDFCFSPDGRLCKDSKQKPNLGCKTSYDFEFDFCKDLIKCFNNVKGYFDYEEFFDFFMLKAKDDKHAKNLFQNGYYGNEKDYNQMLHSVKTIFNQLVLHFLKDKNGKTWYDDEPYICGSTYYGYTGILNCFKEWSKEYVINVHTLNHDLFFERLNKTFGIQGELCDGFEETGSPFYGDLSFKERFYKCRLQYYTEEYDKRFRLYKLHGSRDYGLYYRSHGVNLIPDKYVKSRFGIGFSNLYKEINNNGILDYERCSINYHADFLTGTTSKIIRYKEPFLYKTLFRHFRTNLRNANKLVIVGYGGKDIEINNIIMKNFDYKNKHSFIIDPYASKTLKEFGKSINAKFINKHMEDLNIFDFQ